MRNVASKSVSYGVLATAVLFYSSEARAIVPDNALTFKYFLQTGDGTKHSIDAPIKVRRGEVVKLIIEGQLRQGYHSFPLIQDSPEDGHVSSFLITSVKDEKNNEKDTKKKDFFSLVPPAKETPQFDQLDYLVTDAKKGEKSRVHHAPFSWEQEVLISKEASVGPAKLRISMISQVCDDNNCNILFPKKELQ